MCVHMNIYFCNMCTCVHVHMYVCSICMYIHTHVSGIHEYMHMYV